MYKIIAICSIISNNMYLSNLVVVIVFIYLYTDIINCFKDFSHSFSSFWLNFSSLSSKLFLLRFFSCFCCWLLLFSLRQTCLINRCLLLLFIFIWQTIERNEKREEEIYYYITRIFQIFQSWNERRRRGEKQQDDI